MKVNLPSEKPRAIQYLEIVAWYVEAGNDLDDSVNLALTDIKDGTMGPSKKPNGRMTLKQELEQDFEQELQKKKRRRF